MGCPCKKKTPTIEIPQPVEEIKVEIKQEEDANIREESELRIEGETQEM
jgi:hypothetical protein